MLFLCIYFMVQGQGMLRYEPSPVPPPPSFGNSRPQAPQQQQQRQQAQSQTVRVVGYYYEQNTPTWGSSPSYSVQRASLKIKITDSYNGEAYEVIEYKRQEDYSWQACYGCSVGYDRNEGAYYVNAGITRIYFNI